MDLPWTPSGASHDRRPSPAIRRVAIVGAGTIGASWAALFLAYGLEVVVCDPAADAEPLTRARVAAAWPVLTELGRVAAGASPEALRFDADLAGALRGVDFVQENGPEREDFKTDLFARMDALLPPEVIVASSSSGLIMSRLQARCQHAARFVIGHPFNPPHLIPLVEVVGGKQTSKRRSSVASLSTASWASIRSASTRKSRAISPTASRPRCGARRSTWPPTMSPASPISTPRCRKARDCAGPCSART